MAYFKKWFWDGASYMLAISVLSGLIASFFLPDTLNLMSALNLVQIVMAIVVVIRESRRMFKQPVVVDEPSPRLP